MTDYLGSQAWHDELIALLRTSATPPTRAVIAGKDQGLTNEQIAQRWGELGGVHQRCSAKNVRMRWIEIDAALNAEVPPSPRRAHDIERRARLTRLAARAEEDAGVAAAVVSGGGVAFGARFVT